MRNLLWRPALLLAVLLLPTAWAVETEVEPGDGTLAAAIVAAADGDTLILKPGQFSGDVLVDKSLVIRPDARIDEPYVVADSFNIAGEGIKVTIQGLRFAKNLTLTQGADLRILENAFDGNAEGADIDATEYKSSEGDGKLMIVGNQLGNNAEIMGIYASGAYIAGNTLEHGRIFVYAPAWVVGNEASYTNSHAIYVNAPGKVRVVGNRLYANATNRQTAYGIYVNAASDILMAGNIIETFAAAGSSCSWSCFNTKTWVIYIANPGSVDAEAINNIVISSGSNSYTNRYGIVNADLSTGNIVTGGVNISGGTTNNNLCYTGSCGTDNGNLNVDPKFVNSADDDYHLAEGSPAIDAGPEDAIYADLDRTRNDMGAYGGPWSIEQYDIQRQPSNLGPYVYPLFDANQSFTGGKLKVRVLGVARLR